MTMYIQNGYISKVMLKYLQAVLKLFFDSKIVGTEETKRQK